jgi:hypothetical protein
MPEYTMLCLKVRIVPYNPLQSETAREKGQVLRAAKRLDVQGELKSACDLVNTSSASDAPPSRSSGLPVVANPSVPQRNEHEEEMGSDIPIWALHQAEAATRQGAEIGAEGDVSKGESTVRTASASSEADSEGISSKRSSKKPRKDPRNPLFIKGVKAIKAKNFESAWASWQAAKAEGSSFSAADTMMFAASFLGVIFSKPCALSVSSPCPTLCRNHDMSLAAVATICYTLFSVFALIMKTAAYLHVSLYTMGPATTSGMANLLSMNFCQVQLVCAESLRTYTCHGQNFML